MRMTSMQMSSPIQMRSETLRVRTKMIRPSLVWIRLTFTAPEHDRDHDQGCDDAHELPRGMGCAHDCVHGLNASRQAASTCSLYCGSPPPPFARFSTHENGTSIVSVAGFGGVAHSRSLAMTSGSGL